MLREICENAKLVMESTPIAFIRGHFHVTINLRQITLQQRFSSTVRTISASKSEQLEIPKINKAKQATVDTN